MSRNTIAWTDLASWICAIGVLMGSTGCGSNEFLVHLSRLKEETQRQCKAVDVQKALVPFFAEEHMITNGPPKEVASLPIFDGSTYLNVGFANTSTNVLLITTGSGFGHWGLLVARPGCDQEISDWHKERSVQWDNGVYFFSEFRWVRTK